MGPSSNLKSIFQGAKYYQPGKIQRKSYKHW